MNLGCIFNIKPTTVVLNSTLTKRTIVKVCEIRLKKIGIEDEKLIRFPKRVGQLNIIRSKLINNPPKKNHTSLMTLITTKTIATEHFIYNIST